MDIEDLKQEVKDDIKGKSFIVPIPIRWLVDLLSKLIRKWRNK